MAGTKRKLEAAIVKATIQSELEPIILDCPYARNYKSWFQIEITTRVLFSSHTVNFYIILLTTRRTPITTKVLDSTIIKHVLIYSNTILDPVTIKRPS